MNWNTGLLPIEAQMANPPDGPTEHPAEPPSALPEQAMLIDVRSYAEFMQGHLPGAHCLPLPKLDEMIHALAPDPQTPLIVYCATGARAELALGQLQRLGYRQAHYGGAAMALAKRLGLALSAGM
ncbi:rhodanese-like domain-containing protein [Paucibacter soli]|uniref:rhodanese-like domain-containing protein n=1 Tax=Paucibacter soli TaxID=3133433 RepID=UPI0030A43D5E